MFFGFFKRNALFIIPMVIGGIIIMLLLAFIFGFFVMWLWNWLMPDIFNLSEISYWQAWGLVLLAHIFFKSGLHHNQRNNDSSWKSKIKRKFSDKFNGHEENITE